MQLVVDKIARSFGINEIFKDISFMIDKGEKIGLVGVNGSGKTTLLRPPVSSKWRLPLARKERRIELAAGLYTGITVGLIPF